MNNTTNSIITFFKSILSGIYKLFVAIHNLIPQKARIYVYGTLICILLFVLWTNVFHKQINMMKLDIKISYQEHLQNKSQKKFNKEEAELANEIKIMTQKTIDKIHAKKELCVNKEFNNALKNLREKEIILTDELEEKIMNNINYNLCSYEEIKEKEIEYELKYIQNAFNYKQLESEINKEINNLVQEENTKKEELKINDDNYSIDEVEYLSFLDRTAGWEDEQYEPKIRNKENFKAVFCLYGHWMSSTYKDTMDPWYVITKNDFTEEQRNKLSEYVNKYAYQYIKDDFNNNWVLSERWLIEMMNQSSCQTLKNKLEPKWIKVYEIGKNPLMSLSDKIKMVNDISLQNWYNQTNSIVYELHSNVVGNPDKSWIEVFYSHYEQKNNNMQGRDLAITVLNEISKLHKSKTKVDSVYVVKPDWKSKHAYLGITSATRPLWMIIEYWFKKNLNDVTIMLENSEQIGVDIANWIINFIQ